MQYTLTGSVSRNLVKGRLDQNNGADLESLQLILSALGVRCVAV